MNILFVCTGNICRSPMAEQMLRQRLDAAGITDVRISSAGVMAMEGHNLDGQVASAMRDFGFEPMPHRARQLTTQQIKEADLVLTATTEHRSDVVELHIPANRKTFTLKEFAALAHYVVHKDPSSLNDVLLERLQNTLHNRGMQDSPENLNIADPYKGTDALTHQVARETQAEIERITNWLS